MQFTMLMVMCEVLLALNRGVREASDNTFSCVKYLHQKLSTMCVVSVGRKDRRVQRILRLSEKYTAPGMNL